MSNGDYSKGKSSYTKWDVDSENVDMDMDKEENFAAGPPDQHGQIRVINNSPRSVLFNGCKGRALKALLFVALFISGLLTGYLLRRGVHDYMHSHSEKPCPVPDVYSYDPKNAEFLKNFISANQVMKNMKLLKSWKDKIFIGSEASYRRATEVRDMFKEYGLESVELDRFNVLMSYPSEKRANEVTLLNNKNEMVFNAISPGIPVASHVEGFRKLWPYTLYSASGSIQKQFIYGHYGRREDYQLLQKLGVDVKDHILILRVGKTHVANKVELAEMHGVAGILLYPDPQDHRGKDSSSYLDEPVDLPSDSVVVTNAKMIPGDPETPNTPSTDDSYRLPASDVPLPKIPIQPISPGDAFHLLKYLDGPVAPDDQWKGGLKNLDYKIGPLQLKNKSENNPLSIKLTINNEMKRRDVINVLATIRGKVEPGRYVIIGDQLGSFSSKGIDSGPSDAVFLEIVRSFAALLKTGWRPNRSIIFAAFDAQEFGNIGMEEWLQAHESEIMLRTVAYLGVGRISGSHSFAVQASPLLRKAIVTASKSVPAHDSSDKEFKVYDTWKVRRPQVPNDSKSEPMIDPPGTADDYLDPMCMSGIPTAQFHFVGKSSDKYPFYHTKSYTFGVVQSVANPLMMQSLASVIALTALQLTDSLQLPVSAEDYPIQIKYDLQEFTSTYGDVLQAHNITSAPNLLEALKHLFKLSRSFDNNFSSYDSVDLFLNVREFNDRILHLEKAFLVNPLFGDIVHHENVEVQLVRNLVYGPDPDNVGGVSAFPRLQAAISRAQVINTPENWNIVREELSLLYHSIHNAIGVLSSSVLNSSPNAVHSHH